MAIQSNYEINPDLGFPGDIAQPGFPHAFDSGAAQVPANGRKPRPGDALYYDAANDGWAVPTDAATLLLVSGICTYRKDTVQNRANIVEFEDGDELEIGVFGSFWVTADAALQYGQRMTFDIANFRWEAGGEPNLAGADATPATVASVNTALASLGRASVYCASRIAVAANGLAIARIGYGRLF